MEFPVTWSFNATNIVAQKYFRGTLGTPEREHSLKQVIDRVADTIADWGAAGGYFVDEAETEAFRDEMKHLLVTQKAAFNSPVWFNIGVKGVPQQASACFILSVDDSMNSILNWYREEGVIFKGGSGAGVNLSRIRSSMELLAGGGTASGPVSFMRGADASAGTIKSGGKTRRAAKMVILNVDHPDVQEFVWCKAKEERKARVLRDAGFDMDLDGSDSFSIQYQNANNSVRVTDEFMGGRRADADWELRAVMDGTVLKTVKARELFREIAEAAWECADPGLQFDTTINRWHTAHATGRINGSNPCSEYLHLDNSACNLASLNLLKFLRRRRHLRRRGLQGRGRGHLHRPGDPGRQRRLPDGAASARRRASSASSASATPTSAPCSWRSGLPYDSAEGRAWAGALTVAHDRPRLRHVGPHRRPHGSVRRLRRQRGAHAARPAHAPRRGGPHRRGAGAARAALGRAAGVGRSGRAAARSSACATARPASSRRPAAWSAARSSPPTVASSGCDRSATRRRRMAGRSASRCSPTTDASRPRSSS